MAESTGRPTHRETPDELERSIVEKLAGAGLLTVAQLVGLGTLLTTEGRDTEVSPSIVALYDEGKFDLAMLGSKGWKITPGQVQIARLTPMEVQVLTVQDCLDTGGGLDNELGEKLQRHGIDTRTAAILAEMEATYISRYTLQAVAQAVGLGDDDADARAATGNLFRDKNAGRSGRDN